MDLQHLDEQVNMQQALVECEAKIAYHDGYQEESQRLHHEVHSCVYVARAFLLALMGELRDKGCSPLRGAGGPNGQAPHDN
jgi:hypothetical protein